MDAYDAKRVSILSADKFNYDWRRDSQTYSVCIQYFLQFRVFPVFPRQEAITRDNICHWNHESGNCEKCVNFISFPDFACMLVQLTDMMILKDWRLSSPNHQNALACSCSSYSWAYHVFLPLVICTWFSTCIFNYVSSKFIRRK